MKLLKWLTQSESKNNELSGAAFHTLVNYSTLFTIAVKFATTFSMSAKFWLNLQHAVNISKVRQKKSFLQSHSLINAS